MVFKGPVHHHPVPRAASVNDCSAMGPLAALALLVRTFCFEPFNMPSGSMIPTPLVGDYFFVSKFSCGYSRFSFPLGVPLFSGRILEFHRPERGDVAVFTLPRDNSTYYMAIVYFTTVRDLTRKMLC